MKSENNNHNDDPQDEGHPIELTAIKHGDVAVNVDHSNNTIKYEPVPVAPHINARRSGSASVLTRNEKGEIQVDRKVSAGDINIAIRKRLSASSLPSIIPVSEGPAVPPLINAEDALERTGGKGAAGAYSEHMYPLDVLAEKYKTSIDVHDATKSKGLTSKQAADLLAELGPNVLTPPPKVPLWILFLLQFTNLLMVLLLITATLCIILFFISYVWYNLYIGVLLYIVVFLTCYETFSQEAKSDTLMEQFRALVPEQAQVVRDGSLQPIDATQLVIGDIIRLKSGDKIPADCRVILNESMKVSLNNVILFCSFTK
jgi:sodium/potassium-transporting ATPase subunit alpha